MAASEATVSDCLCGEINARHCPVHQEPPRWTVGRWNSAFADICEDGHHVCLVEAFDGHTLTDVGARRVQRILSAFGVGNTHDHGDGSENQCLACGVATDDPWYRLPCPEDR